MNWLGSFPSLRLCTVLLNRYLSPYLDVPLDDSQINYDNSQALCSNLSLNLEKINAHFHAADVPFTVCAAYIEKIVLNNPFSGITGSETLGIEVHGLEVEFKPKRQGHMPPTDDMLQSMVTSVMSGIPDTMEQSIIDTFQSSNVSAALPNQDIVGGLMNVIYDRLCNASVSLFNVLIRLEYCPPGATRGMGLQLTISSLEIAGGQSRMDESDSTDSRPDQGSKFVLGQSSSIKQVSKRVNITDIQLNWDVFTVTSADEENGNPMSDSCTLSDSMTESRFTDSSSYSSISHRQLAQAASRQKPVGYVPPPSGETSDLTTVLMLSIPGQCTAEFCISTPIIHSSHSKSHITATKATDPCVQNPTEPGIHLNLQFSAIHTLLSPEQVHWIVNLCEELNSNSTVALALPKIPSGKGPSDPYRGNIPLRPEEIQRWKMNDSRSVDCRDPYAESVYFKSCISYANDLQVSSEMLSSELFTSAIADNSQAAFTDSSDEQSTLASFHEAALGRFVTPVSPRRFTSRKNAPSDQSLAATYKGTQCIADIGIKIEFFSLVLLHRQPRASRPDPCSDLILQQEALQQRGKQQDNEQPIINKALQQAQADSEELRQMAERHFSLLRQLKTTPSAYADQLASLPTSSSRLHFLRLVRANLIELCEMDHLSLLIHNICFNARRESSSVKVTNIYELTLGNPILSEILYFKNAAHDLRGLVANLCSRRPVDVHEIISFPESGSCHEENPCLQVHVQMNTPTGNTICKAVDGLSSNIPLSCGPEKGFELRCTLASCEVELDVTVIDRVQHLLSYPYMSRQNRTRPSPQLELNEPLQSVCTSPLPRSCSMMDSMYVDLNSPEDESHFTGKYSTAAVPLVTHHPGSNSRSTTSLYFSCPGCVKVHLFIPLPRGTGSNLGVGSNVTGVTPSSASVPGCSVKSPCTWKRYVCSDSFRLDFTKPSLCSTFTSTDMKTSFMLQSEQILVSLCRTDQVEPIKLLVALPNTTSPETLLPSISVCVQPSTKRFESCSMSGDNTCDLSLQLHAATSDCGWSMGEDFMKGESCCPQDRRPLPLRFEHSYCHNPTFSRKDDKSYYQATDATEDRKRCDSMKADNRSYYRPSDAEEMKRYHTTVKDIAEINVSITLPYLLVQLQNKALLDSAYERLGCELPLWKPAIFALEDSLLPLNPPWLLGCYPSHCILHHDQFVICPWANAPLKPTQRSTAGGPISFMSSPRGAAEFQDFPDPEDRNFFTSGEFQSMEEDFDSYYDEEEDEESEQGGGVATPTGPSVLRSSMFCISINIDRGYVSALVPLNSPDMKKVENKNDLSLVENTVSTKRSHSDSETSRSKENPVGKFHFRLKQAHIFYESGHNGDANLSYLTVHLLRASIYHRGNMTSPTLNDLDQPQAVIDRPPSDILITLLPMPGGIQPCFSQPLSGLNMLALAIQFKDYPALPQPKKASTSRPVSSTDKKQKYPERPYQGETCASSTPLKMISHNRPHQDVIVALTIQESLLLYRVVRNEEFWVNQLIEWFQFPTVELPGYTLPTTSTKLCINFTRMAADYSSSDLAYCGLLTSETVTLSTHILSDSMTSLLEIGLEGVGLFVAPSLLSKEISSRKSSCVVKPTLPRVNLCTLHEALLRNVRTHYVPVVDLSQLELSISVNPLHVKTCPLVDIRCTNQNLSFHSCADSCLAVIFILRHIATEIDRLNSTSLSQSSCNPPSSTSTFPHTASMSSLSVVTETMLDSPSATRLSPSDSRHEEFHNIMQDALREPLQRMQEQRSPQAPEKNDGLDGDFSKPALIHSPRDDFEVIQREMVPSPGEVARCLLSDFNERIMVEEDHFAPVPLYQHRKSPFCEPKRYPQAELAVTLHDISLSWKFFGGSDFASAQSCDSSNQSQSRASIPPTVRPTSDIAIPSAAMGVDGRSSALSTTSTVPQAVRRMTHHNQPYHPMSSAVDIRPSSSWDRDRFPAPPSTQNMPSSLWNASCGNPSSLRSVNSEVSLFSMNSGTSRMQHRMPMPPSFTQHKLSSSLDTTRHRTSVSSAQTAARRKQDWWRQGGSGRDHNKAVEIKLSKLHFRFATFSPRSRFSSRCVMTIQNLEILDHVTSSEFDKLLYQFSNQDMPYDDNAPFFRLKLLIQKAGVYSRPDNSKSVTDGDDSLEMEIKSSLQPLRIRLDQDTIEMLEQYFSKIVEQLKCAETIDKPTGTVARVSSYHSSHSLSRDSSSCSRESGSSRSPYCEDAVLSVDLVQQEATGRLSSSHSHDLDSSAEGHDPEEPSLWAQKGAVFDELSPHTESCEQQTSDPATSSSENSSAVEPVNPSTSPKRIYIRRFTFSPDVPILLDYRGKRINMTHGALTGIVKCLADFNKSYIVIHNLKYERGLKDVYRLMEVITEDLQADLARQWPGLLSGLGPMHEIIQIVSGLRDLVWMPVESYREDGSVMRGIKKGTRSFYSSAITSALELLWRTLNVCHNVSAVSHDLLTPGHSLRSRRPRLRQPADLREGCSNAAATVSSGISNLREDFALAISNGQLSGKGAAGTAGEILRQILPACIVPIAVGTEATGHIIGGLRNQMRPDSQNETRLNFRPASLQ